MKTKILILSTCSIFIFSGCGGSSGSGSGTQAAQVQGTDLSGTYRSTQVKCVSTSGSVTALANITGVNSTVAVQGNTYTGTSFSSNCSVTTTGHIEFDSTSNTMTLSGQTPVPSNGTTCSVTESFATTSGATITPSSITTTFSSGQALPDKSASYFADGSGNFFLFTVLQDSANPTDMCFIEYQKL